MSTGCSDDTPPIDSNCADPAYRAAHPDECRNFTLLIIKPEHALREPGQNQEYVVTLRANGTEIVLTQGLTFESSNVGVAVVNQDGVATGVLAGHTTISVQWQNLSAHAQLDVVGSCAETNQHFRILIDHSPSMNQLFSPSYATKLSFSKSVAADFADSINYSKDDVAVSKFASDYEELLERGIDPDAARTAIQSISIAGTGEKTHIAGALQEAIDSFPADGVKVLVMFSDGEWSGTNPKAIAQAFKESGGFLVIVATESWGTYFADMAEMASGGFLLSAYDDTEDDILDSLAGLKSFICSADCAPESGEAPMAELNYTDFINWDVTLGKVDLIGLGVWDVIGGGQGLYVDLRGSILFDGEEFDGGQLTSKADFDFTEGEDYKFTIHVAGSNVLGAGAGTYSIRVRCGDELDETIEITNPQQQFLPYEFEWTPTGTHSGKIIIEQVLHPGHVNVGTLIDDITLENLTTATVLLHDDFDEENPTLIPEGYSSYGCLQTPPGAQSASLNPPTPRVVE